MQRRIGILVYIKSFFLRYRAIFFIVGLAVASIVGVIHLFNISNNHNVELIGLSSIKESSKAFTDLERNVNHTLSVALEVLAPNDKIAELFAKREREALLHECEPLFFHLKKQNRITHWYFINPAPEKTCFLRVHNPTLHDDVITRVTLENCIKTGKYSFGKEMGKTALALRAVRPYYYKGRLLGYMELAVQVEDFLEMLKEQSGNEYCLLLKKKLVDKARWKSIIKDKNIPDNWDDMDYLLLIYSTWQCIYFNKYNNILMDMKDIPDEELVLEKIDRDDNNYIRGMFPFYDASGRKTGIILSLKEITPIIGAMEGQKKEVVLMILGFMGLITFFMIFFHKRAEKELRKYRNQLEDMVQDSTAELREINMRLNREIKEHKAAQKALEEECKARQEAEEKNVQAVKHAERSARLASIGVMAASITHEINQPLNAIKVTADSIQYWHKRNPGALPDPFVDQLNIITQSVRRIVEIVQHMRTFWVIPDAPKISELDINQAVKNALSLTRQQLHSHGIQEVMNLPVKPLIVKGNMVHLEQIIVNLVVNAVHALDEKKTKYKRIEITTYVENKNAILIIRDNGPGLPTEDRNSLFDPFYSTNNNGEGMGLGLAIVKRYIDRHGGRIKAENPTGGGARFTIRFPLSNKKTEDQKRIQLQ